MSVQSVNWRIKLAYCFLGLLISITACQSQPAVIEFDGEKLAFPITVKEAVGRYNLSFNPPGHYYRNGGLKNLSINIAYRAGDYDDEHQSEEVLFDRNVVSYVLQYNGDKTPFDSLRQKVERLCHCKLTFVTDSLSPERDPGFKPFPRSIQDRLPQKGLHYYAVASLNKEVAVGFRRRPTWRGENIVEVQFFYQQSPADIRHGMMQN